MKRYECMFLFDNAVAYEWPAVEQEINRLCERIGANLLACVKYDERKLAYEVNGRKRGTYVLSYMEAPSDRIRDLERDVQLSESILRLLVLRDEKLTEERLAELRAWPKDKPLNPMAPERRDDHGDRGDRYGDRGDRGDRYGDRDGDRGPRRGDDRGPRGDDRGPRDGGGDDGEGHGE